MGKINLQLGNKCPHLKINLIKDEKDNRGTLAL